MNVAERPMLQSVGDGIEATRSAWSFGGSVAETFEEHVRRSVPGYDAGHELVLQISDFFVHDDSVCYEIGSSTGKLICALAERHAGRGSWIGVDIERAMVDFAVRRNEGSRVRFALADACRFDYQPCDLVVAYYTVQFVRPRDRQRLVDALYQALNWGGALLLFEKVRAPDARFQDLCTGLYNDFKRSHDFSPAEIMAKSDSLRGVLEPFSSAANVDMLRRAGFVDVMSVFKQVCFEGFLAIK